MALRDNDFDRQRAGLEALISDYWYPCYAYLRRRGLSPADAEDIAQDFFAGLLESGGLQQADPERGRFRNFLVASLRNHLANHVKREQTQKRGGLCKSLSLDFDSAENRYALEPVDLETPQQLFDRRWALTLMANSLERVRSLYEKSGRSAIFDRLKEHLVAGDSPPLGEMAASIGLSEAALRVALHRLRKRCREALRAEVARTLQSNDDLDSELTTLMDWVS